MDSKLNVGCLTKAIPTEQIDQLLSQILEPLKSELVEMLEQFAAHEPTPAGTLQAGNALADRLRTIGREVVAWLFSQIEPPVEQMPGTIVHRGESHRRLADKVPRTDVVTRFEKISLIPARYWRGRSGETVFPLEILLGIEDGVTPAAATRIGKAFAPTGSTQGRTLEMIEDQMGKRIGTGKLRRLIATLREQGYPIGSGVVESACKQIVSERIKLSGMRWHKTGGQHTMTLRCLLLSGIWDTVYKHWLASKPTVRDLLPSQMAA